MGFFFGAARRCVFLFGAVHLGKWQYSIYFCRNTDVARCLFSGFISQALQKKLKMIYTPVLRETVVLFDIGEGVGTSRVEGKKIRFPRLELTNEVSFSYNQKQKYLLRGY